MKLLDGNKEHRWAGDWNIRGHRTYLIGHPEITIKDDSSYHRSDINNYLEISSIISLQNYKNYLPPSIDLGFAIGLRKKNFVHELGLYWEPLFLFGTGAH